MYVSTMWQIKVPPRVHFFLCLLSKNRNLTRDNVNIRKILDDLTCLFCSELETRQHLFFDCVVAKQMCSCMTKVLDRNVGSGFISIGQLWLWKLRNHICFQGVPWLDMRNLLLRIATLLHSWLILCPPEWRQDS